jgi:putative ABC transport system permease protein
MIRLLLRPGVRRLFRLPLRTNDAIHADVDDELESLIAIRVEHLIARGMSPSDARAEALGRLGATLDDARQQLHQSAEHRERHMRFREHLETLAQDLRYAARGLARRPAFTAVAVLTLAIGIGATTAIFSAVNVLILRPLPYANPGELMKLSLVTPTVGGRKGSNQVVWSYPKYTLFRDSQQAFSEVAPFDGEPFVLTSGDVERVNGEFVGATYLRTLGLRPIVGRDFERAADAHVGGPMEVIIGTSLWERRFNADPNVIGRVLAVDRKSYTIIGVAPRAFKGLSGQAEFFLPITTSPADQLSEAQSHWFNVVARRKPNVSSAQVEASMIAFGKRMSETYPDNFVGKAAWSAHSIPLDDARVAPVVKRSVLILFGAVGFVLLIACVNVANLQLGRASSRRREIAVRMAIGAGRGRLVRLLVTESVLLALIGGVVALVIAWIGTRGLSSVSPQLTARAGSATIGAVDFAAIRLDWTALVFAFGLALAIGVLFGLAPALQATRSTLSNALKEGGTDSKTGVAQAFTGRRFLVVVEVALALVLLAGSGLMIRSLTKMLAIDTGFDASHVLTLRLTVPEGGLARDSLPGFYTQLLQRLRAVPGVTDASLGSCPPLSGGCNKTLVTFPGQPEPDFAHQPLTGVLWASPDYFSTLRISLKRGRMITDADRFGGPKVLLINEAGARTLWPNENAVGKRVKIGQGGFNGGDGAEVVGVVGDSRQLVDSAAHTEVYLPFAQSPRSGIIILVRSTRDVASLGPELRRAIHEVAPSFPVYDLQTMSARAAKATAQARFSASLLGLFALTALSLAAVGIYGVMALAVAARTREIGIRIALGADRGRVQRLVVGEGVALALFGTIIGVSGALLATRVMRSLLFDLTPSDPVTYVTIVAILAAAAIVASWIPARRASRVDPVVALRTE